MNRYQIVGSIFLATLLLAGCAGKKAQEAVNTPAPDPVSTASADTTGSQGTSTPATSTASATLATLDGSQLETVYFDYDSFTLQPNARKVLERNAAWLQANPTVKITIEGHCDERGSDEYNLALGERRALAVKNHLVALGIGKERLATISYGEERPAVAGHDETVWSKNRRSEFK